MMILIQIIFNLKLVAGSWSVTSLFCLLFFSCVNATNVIQMFSQNQEWIVFDNIIYVYIDPRIFHIIYTCSQSLYSFVLQIQENNVSVKQPFVSDTYDVSVNSELHLNLNLIPKTANTRNLYYLCLKIKSNKDILLIVFTLLTYSWIETLPITTDK